MTPFSTEKGGGLQYSSADTTGIYILHAPVVHGWNKLQERYSGRGNLRVTEFGVLPP
jgi:hypothetical protein